MVLKTSIYSISEKDEHRLIENKEAISMLKTDSPDVIENVGLDVNLLGTDKKLKEIGNKKELREIESRSFEK